MRIPITVYETAPPHVSLGEVGNFYGWEPEDAAPVITNVGGQMYLVSVIGEKDG